jgi:hypothetical protein
VSLFVLQESSKLTVLGDGYLEPESASELESASGLLRQFATQADSQYNAWAQVKDTELEQKLVSMRAEERAQANSLLNNATEAMKEAIQQARTQEIDRIRSALKAALSDQASEWLIAAAIAKATESGVLDADSRVLVPEYARDRLIENLGQLISFDDYLFLNKIVEEHDYVTEGSAIVVTPVEAFKFDAQAIAHELIS